MDFYELCRVAPDMIRVELREPALVRQPLRDATAVELQVGGVSNVIGLSFHGITIETEY